MAKRRSNRQKAIIKRRIFICSALAVILALLVGIFCLVGNIIKVLDNKPSSDGGSKDKPNSSQSTPKEPYVVSSATVVNTGDIIVHSTVLDGAKTKDGGYDFSAFFGPVESYFKDADLAVANLEVTFGGTAYKYSGYPAFNTPDSLADVMKKAGINLFLTSNNHCYDTGLTGLKRTANVLKSKKIDFIGTLSYLFLSLITAYPVAKSNIKIVAMLNAFLVYAMLFHNDTMAMLRYVVMSKIGIIDTYWAVILPGLASTMGIFLIAQFIRANIQDSILEAARIDGAGEFKILFSIVAPSIKAGWLTALIFTFQSYWNQGSSNAIFSEELKHISVAMQSIATSGITRAGTGMAVTLILMIPTVIIFLWNQRSIMNTMAHSGLK